MTRVLNCTKPRGWSKSSVEIARIRSNPLSYPSWFLHIRDLVLWTSYPVLSVSLKVVSIGNSLHRNRSRAIHVGANKATEGPIFKWWSLLWIFHDRQDSAYDASSWGRISSEFGWWLYIVLPGLELDNPRTDACSEILRWWDKVLEFEILII